MFYFQISSFHELEKQALPFSQFHIEKEILTRWCQELGAACLPASNYINAYEYAHATRGEWTKS